MSFNNHLYLIMGITTHSSVQTDNSLVRPTNSSVFGASLNNRLIECMSASYQKEFPFYEQMTHRQRLRKTVTMSGKRRISKDNSDENRIKEQSR